MKRVLILLVFLFITLFSCYRPFNNLRHTNVKWTSKNGEIEFIVGNIDSVGIGRINGIDKVLLLNFFEFSDTIYFTDNILFDVYDEENIILSMDVLADNKNTKPVIVKTRYNGTGLSDLDDKVLYLYETPLEEFDLDAANYISQQLINEEYQINIKQYADLIYTKASNGTITYQENIIPIQMKYFDNKQFEIINVQTNDLLLSGTYITSFNTITLLFQTNNLYKEIMSIELSVKEGHLWSFYEDLH